MKTHREPIAGLNIVIYFGTPLVKILNKSGFSVFLICRGKKELKNNSFAFLLYFHSTCCFSVLSRDTGENTDYVSANLHLQNVKKIAKTQQ